MPIYERILFRCIKCSFEEYRLVGDNKVESKEHKPCSRCGSYMARVDSINSNYLDEVVGICNIRVYK
jgi:Zn finger protein HypA/HybF involved in hydrogenase expression